jgi:hypothetical protein
LAHLSQFALALRLSRRPFRVVASPPCAITTQLLRLLRTPGSRLIAADRRTDRAPQTRTPTMSYS